MKNIEKHNDFYLNEDRRKKPKEYFKFIRDKSINFLSSSNVHQILDIGCAAGDFLYYMMKECPQNLHWSGMDISQEVLDTAKIRTPEANYYLGNIYNKDKVPTLPLFDAIFMSGVHYLFDDYKRWIDHLISISNNGARIYVFGTFNPEDLDLRGRLSRSGENDEIVWNVFSKTSISKYLNHIQQKCYFHDWEIPIDIPRTQSDPIRSWTIPLASGKRIVINGTQMLHCYSLLEIEVTKAYGK